jgi:aminopeptidase N
VNSYFLPGDEAGGRKALDWAAKALTVYQKEFGAYPYRELDVVETGTTAGGIEYPGLVAVASRFYSDANRQAVFESATVHEVAHQWWYNVVGNDQVNHPWLDEALAQYATYRYFQDAYGEAGGQGFIESLASRWATVGRGKKPISLPVGDYTAKEYGAIG